MITSRSDYQTSCVVKIEERLTWLLRREGTLEEAMRYAVLGPGKRLRPQMTIASAELFGVSLDVALDPACALELIHAYSLIHDDLPCMDDDDVRRGRPTLHRVFGEATALLAGNALLTYAFELLAKARGVADGIKAKLFKCMALRAGTRGMVGGQMRELLMQNPTEVHVLGMIQQKTGDLFSAALEMGALLGRAPFSQLKTMRRLGLLLGVAFQLRDDVQDGDGLLSWEESERVLCSTRAHIKQLVGTLPRRGALEALIASMC